MLETHILKEFMSSEIPFADDARRSGEQKLLYETLKVKIYETLPKNAQEALDALDLIELSVLSDFRNQGIAVGIAFASTLYRILQNPLGVYESVEDTYLPVQETNKREVGVINTYLKGAK